jgi:hypothetical protein
MGVITLRVVPPLRGRPQRHSYRGAQQRAERNFGGGHCLSAVADAGNCLYLCAFGNADATKAPGLQYAMDRTDFYAGASVTLSVAGNFYTDATRASRYLRLLSSAVAIITATIAAE